MRSIISKTGLVGELSRPRNGQKEIFRFGKGEGPDAGPAKNARYQDSMAFISRLISQRYPFTSSSFKGVPQERRPLLKKVQMALKNGTQGNSKGPSANHINSPLQSPLDRLHGHRA